MGLLLRKWRGGRTGGKGKEGVKREESAPTCGARGKGGSCFLALSGMDAPDG